MFSIEEMATILSALPDPAFVLTRSGRCAAIFGGRDGRRDGSALAGKTLAEMLTPEKTAWFLAQIEIALATRMPVTVEYALSLGDVKTLGGEGPDAPVWFEARLQPLDLRVDGEEAVLWVVADITERHELEQRLLAQSRVDALTGLWNRRQFDAAANLELERARRYCQQVSLLILDIDHFKAINDSRGHQIGDTVLIEIAAILRGGTRVSDCVARWGGEEFAILMPETHGAEAARAADNIRAAVEGNPFSCAMPVTVSVGIAEFHAETDSLDDLIRRADDALYRAKTGGRNRIDLAA